MPWVAADWVGIVQMSNFRNVNGLGSMQGHTIPTI